MLAPLLESRRREVLGEASEGSLNPSGTPAVIVDIQRQPGANVTDGAPDRRGDSQVAARHPGRRQAERLTAPSRSAPPCMTQFTPVLSVVLVTLVVLLLFLRSLRATLIVFIARCRCR